MKSHHRRGLVGLDETARPPTTPVEVTLLVTDGITHVAAKQIRALCAGGIDNWWLETWCGVRAVVTSMAPKPVEATCMLCLAMSG
jgi:hypothetical protein